MSKGTIDGLELLLANLEGSSVVRRANTAPGAPCSLDTSAATRAQGRALALCYRQSAIRQWRDEMALLCKLHDDRADASSEGQKANTAPAQGPLPSHIDPNEE
jgi:hypothetical protein